MAKEGIPNKAEKHVEEVVKRFNASEIGDSHCFFDGKIINSFLNCSYKAFLAYHNELGIKTEYELLELELLQKYKGNFFNKLHGNPDEIHVLKSLESMNDIESQKLIYIIDPVFQSNQFSIHFDALEISPSKDSSRSFLYIPVSVSPNEKISTTEKLLLSIKSLFLRTFHNIDLEYGKIIYGRSLRTTKFALNTYSRKAAKLLKELTKIINNEEPPKFYQNNHCQICEFQSVCRTKLVERDDLSLLGRIGQKEIDKLNNKGIFTIHQLSYTYRPKKRKKKYDKLKRLEYPLKALALREKRTYIIEIPSLPISKTEIYFDVEGLPDEDFFYLIGMLIIKDGEKSFFSFWVDSQSDIEKVFTNFIDTIMRFQDFTVYHYGSYELQALKNLNRVLNNRYEKEIELILKKSINILSFFSSHIYPPVYTNSLKDIAHHIGFEWADKNASGIRSIVWRKKWELIDEINYKNKIIQYNIDDCEALYSVKKWITSIEDSLNNENNEIFAKVNDLQSVSYLKWGKPRFQIPEFEKINKYAYFDYQRNKVYLRTNKNVKRAINREKKYSSQINKIDKVLNYLPINCPNCNHNKFYKLDNKKKLIINVKFMKYGVKKWNLQLPASSFQCSGCHKEFSLQRYGRNMMIWSINQYVAHQTSMPRIGKMLVENFNIYVHDSAIYRFKENIAKEYESTYEEIKQIIRSGHLIHADETKTAVKGNPNSYVWVFTSMNTVYYIYKPNREADFLRDLLKDFQGVLVSDFYPGYDSLPCQQQKCLVHLIRDLNDDFLNNQLNKEYKNIVVEFGKILREIIETVDMYGLKKRHLHKHKKSIEMFYSQILDENYETELAISWQKRFKKNKEKLFNFINYDDIPWNNNNGENAIKPVAKYRSRAKGILHEEGVKSFLVLLSIQQTCKFRGINFLNFLKSREQSIEEYCRKN